VYRRILGPVYSNEKENWRILTNKETYSKVKKTYCNRDSKFNPLALELDIYSLAHHLCKM